MGQKGLFNLSWWCICIPRKGWPSCPITRPTISGRNPSVGSRQHPVPFSFKSISDKVSKNLKNQVTYSSLIGFFFIAPKPTLHDHSALPLTAMDGGRTNSARLVELVQQPEFCDLQRGAKGKGGRPDNEAGFDWCKGRGSFAEEPLPLAEKSWTGGQGKVSETCEYMLILHG